MKKVILFDLYDTVLKDIFFSFKAGLQWLHRKHKEWEVEYMTLYLRDMENRDEGREEGIAIGLERGLEQGLEQGLSALVNTIKSFTTDAEEIYQAVIKNEAYKDTPREEVLKYLK